MTETLSKHERNLSSIIHASTFSKFFIPFGNFILPLILWTANKKELEFVDHNGKLALNFQISLLLYSTLLCVVSIPFFIHFVPNVFDIGFLSFNKFHNLNNINISFNRHDFKFGSWWLPLGIIGLLQGALTIVNIVYTILATIKTNEGETFKYPISINFIK